jgi:uncharacterized membrane protein
MTFWVVWAVAYLGLTWFLLIRSSAQQTRQWALDQRIPLRPHLSILRSVALRVLRVLILVSRTSSLFFIVLVSLVSLVLAISLAPEVRDLQTTRGISLAFMAALGVVLAWGVLHTSYALHYAYLYYRSEASPGGLTFPGEQSPKQRDFAYFAFTVGTSFAVSDVDVTGDAPGSPRTSDSLVFLQHLDPGHGGNDGYRLMSLASSLPAARSPTEVDELESRRALLQTADLQSSEDPAFSKYSRFGGV